MIYLCLPIFSSKSLTNLILGSSLSLLNISQESSKDFFSFLKIAAQYSYSKRQSQNQGSFLQQNSQLPPPFLPIFPSILSFLHPLILPSCPKPVHKNYNMYFFSCDLRTVESILTSSHLKVHFIRYNILSVQLGLPLRASHGKYYS